MRRNDMPGSYGCAMNVFDSIEEMCDYIRCRYDEGSDVWLNLSNGALLIDELEHSGIEFSFIRIMSTMFERKIWSHAIDAIPDDMLVRAAMGRRQMVVDFGANKLCPRAMRQGLAIAMRRLSMSWDKSFDDRMWIFDRSGNPIVVDDEFARNTMRLDKHQKKRLAYFGKFVTNNPLRIEALCASTDSDGDYAGIRNMMIDHLAQ